jgi:hypothetical protein
VQVVGDGHWQTVGFVMCRWERDDFEGRMRCLRCLWGCLGSCFSAAEVIAII